MRASSLLLLLLCLGLAACQAAKPPLSKNAAQLRERVQKSLALLQDGVVGALKAGDSRQVDRALAEAMGRFPRKMGELDCGVMVLDGAGKLVAARRLEERGSANALGEAGGQSYSQYAKFRDVLKKGGVSQFTLFTGQGKLYVACRPLMHGPRQVGAGCLILPQWPLPPERRVEEAEFLRLNLKD